MQTKRLLVAMNFPIAGRRRQREARPPDYSSADSRLTTKPGCPTLATSLFLSPGWVATNPNRPDEERLYFRIIHMRGGALEVWARAQPRHKYQLATERNGAQRLPRLN